MQPQEPDTLAALPLPALLRSAGGGFSGAIRRALDGAGLEDVPPNGPYVLGAIARTGAPLGEVIRRLGVSKQAGGQLVDTLVSRGYLERDVDPEDRRRLVVGLTARGRSAAAVIRAAVAAVEADLIEAVGEERVGSARVVLAALTRAGAGDG